MSHIKKDFELQIGLKDSKEDLNKMRTNAELSASRAKWIYVWIILIGAAFLYPLIQWPG